MVRLMEVGWLGATLGAVIPRQKPCERRSYLINKCFNLGTNTATTLAVMFFANVIMAIVVGSQFFFSRRSISCDVLSPHQLFSSAVGMSTAEKWGFSCRDVTVMSSTIEDGTIRFNFGRGDQERGSNGKTVGTATSSP